ncbi:MAG: prepilin peptidase [Pseudomonadota bacterium]
MFNYYLLLFFPAVMVFAALLDIFTMTISNKISLVLLGSFLVIAPLTGMAWDQFLSHIGIGFVILVIGIVLFAFGFLGGGDAKLLAAASLWIGYDLPVYLLAVTQIGAVLAIAILIYRKMSLPLWMPNWQWAMRLHNKKEGIPYGVAIAGGVLLIFPTTSWFLAAAV